LSNEVESQSTQKFADLSSKLGFFIVKTANKLATFTKTKP